MTTSFSIYLDAIRLFAALAVFYRHYMIPDFVGRSSLAIPYIGTDAVMVFFVLSGLVISYVANEREPNGLRGFMLSRVSRLGSVAWPALILTICLDAIGQRFDPSLYANMSAQGYAGSYPWLRLAVNSLFLGETWFYSIRPLSDVSYWSINYEMSYYILFGFAFYLRGRKRLVAVAIAAAAVGPPVLLLFPVWLCGATVYLWLHRGNSVSLRLGAGMFLGPIIAYVVYRKFGIADAIAWRETALLGANFDHALSWSSGLSHKYIMGALVAVHLMGASVLAPRFAAYVNRIQRPIRFAAGFTFSLYLFHQPLLYFFAALIGDVPSALSRQLLLLFLVLGCIVLLGLVTEKKRHVLRAWLSAAIDHRLAARVERLGKTS